MFNKTPASSDADHQTTEPVQDTLGCYLKAARLNQGLELAEIAAETRIDIKNLAFLEDDNRSALPADVFTRGFVKLYATYLNLDPQEAIRRYEQQWGENLEFEVSPLEKIKSPPSFWPGIIIAITLIAVLFGVRFFSPAPNIENGSIPVPGTSSPTIGKSDSPSPVLSEAAHLDNPTPPADVPTEQLPPGTESPPYEIVLSCSEEIPLTISLDGVRNTESVCPPKSPQTWKAEKGFDLSLSSTRGVTLSINGVNVPVMRPEGRATTIHRP